MKTINVGHGTLESVIGQGLRVLCGEGIEGITEGESVLLVETSADEPTGRRFFARVMYAPGEAVIQIDLAPFMEQYNSETDRFDRIPMAGEYANEKASIPLLDWDEWDISIPGQKPLWVYRNEKWLEEISISRMVFGPAKRKEFAQHTVEAPEKLTLKIQGQGGEKYFVYGKMNEVKG